MIKPEDRKSVMATAVVLTLGAVLFGYFYSRKSADSGVEKPIGALEEVSLKDFGRFEVTGSVSKETGEKSPGYVVYTPPEWLRKLPDDIRWKRIILSHRTPPVGQWRDFGGETIPRLEDLKGKIVSAEGCPWLRTKDGKVYALPHHLCVESHEKTFYVRASVKDETQQWDPSPSVPITLHAIKRKQ